MYQHHALRSAASPSPVQPAGVGISQMGSALWNASANGAGGGGAGLQTPGGAGKGAAGSAAGPSRLSRQPSVEPVEEEQKATDVDALMDVVGASGVDIGAEEEGMRLANERIAAPPAGPVMADRSRKQDFIDPQVLADVVKKIAAAFQLRTLEPDTIPLIALAARHRLLSIITAAIAARDHRQSASHLRPPPTKRARAPTSDDELDPYEERRRSKGKGRGIEGEEEGPAWDVLVLDEQEKLLGALERVDREEERRNRRERMVREQKEQDDRDLAEAVAASAAAEAEREAEKGRGDLGDKLVMGASGGGGSGTSTPKGKGKGDGEGSVKPKKEKKEKKGQMSEDVRKRLTDQVAMRSIGGRSFSWLNSAGGSPAPSTPTPGGLPKPKFTPGASSLPPPSFSPSPAHTSLNSSQPNGPSGLSRSSYTASSLDRLGVPLSHDANLGRREKQDWEKGVNVVERGDLIWALERERGMGTGKGRGRDTLVRNGAGVGKKTR